jgi:glycosyltransferase involved in cell wall biosynthesis
MGETLSESRIGLMCFHPEPNHVEAQPNKLFEYMSAGIPVVASDFAYWRNIVDSVECGLLVDPLDPAAIAAAVKWLLEHPEEAARMGERGREAVRNRFTWTTEAQSLLTLYQYVITR